MCLYVCLCMSTCLYFVCRSGFVYLQKLTECESVILYPSQDLLTVVLGWVWFGGLPFDWVSVFPNSVSLASLNRTEHNFPHCLSFFVSLKLNVLGQLLGFFGSGLYAFCKLKGKWIVLKVKYYDIFGSLYSAMTCRTFSSFFLASYNAQNVRKR
jgi:hypothetical protein